MADKCRTFDDNRDRELSTTSSASTVREKGSGKSLKWRVRRPLEFEVTGRAGLAFSAAALVEEDALVDALAG